MTDHEDLLLFQVGGQICALRTGAVQEVLFLPRLARPPGLPALVAGFLDLRGEVVPVVRLDRLLDAGSGEPGLYTPLVVLRGPSVALQVDRVDQVRHCEPAAMVAVRAGHCFNECAEAEVAVEGGLAHVLNPERLLLAEEHQRLQEWRERAQRYLAELEAKPA